MSINTKATHIMLESEAGYLKRGERVYVLLDEGLSCVVQSVAPSKDDGRWWTARYKLARINTQMENK